jgi:Rrf2 family protein
MRFEVSTDYAIRALRLLHVREGEVLTTMEIAQSIGITYPVFSKIATKLRLAGILKTIQGQKGGYVLGKPANEISIYEVFLCIEGDLRINHCLEDGELCSHGDEVECKVHGLLYGIQEDLINKFSNVFVSDLG